MLGRLIRLMMSCRLQARNLLKGRSGVRARVAKTALALTLSLAAASPSFARQSRDVEVIERPSPKYPMLASWLRLEGYCHVRFSVDEVGRAFAVTPSCTRTIFCSEAERSVADAKFSPKLVDGVPKIRTNVVIPLTWSMQGSGYDDTNDPRPLELCQQKVLA